MKKIILGIMLVFSLVLFTSCNNNQEEQGTTNIEANEDLVGESNVLVTYFSWSSSNNTQTMANYIKDSTGGELFRIIPETPYTTNYNEVLDVAREEKNNSSRPLLAQSLTQEQLDNYDVVFVGYPVWWGDAPMIVYTFLESLDFSNKTIVTFATSGGSGLSDSNLKRTINATFLDGLCISGFQEGDSSKNRVDSWITNLGYHI